MSYSFVKPAPIKPCHLKRNELMVDRSGYVDKQLEIESLIDSGRRLDEYRREMYYDGIPTELDLAAEEDVQPNLRHMSEMDIQDHAQALTERAQARKVKAAKMAADAAQAASSAPPGAIPPQGASPTPAPAASSAPADPPPSPKTT